MKNSFFVLFVVFSLPVSFIHSQDRDAVSQATDNRFFEMLDANHDGTLDPYEALDVLMQLESELDGKPVTAGEVGAILEEIRSDELNEIAEMLDEMDANDDGKTTLDEVDESMREFAKMFDENGDGTITAEEASGVDFQENMFLTEEEIKEEVQGLFEELDVNQDQHLSQEEAVDEMPWSQISEGDTNRDARVSQEEMIAFLANDNSRANFQIVQGRAVMSGVINADTPAKVLRLIYEHPEVRTIEMANVPGSIDDEANLRAARYVRKFGFTTVLTKDGSVASGGTDFFLAGKKRLIEDGARLGIHSWGGPGFQGKDVPREHPQHQLYLKYYEEMGIPSDFYWRTLEAAPANDIHWMTGDELDAYRFRTSSPDPDAGSGSPDGDEHAQVPEVNLPASAKLVKSTRIAKIPSDFPRKYRRAFDRYVQVVAPNGKPVNIFAQEEITDAQLRHVRDVMLHYLTNLPDSAFGVDKSEVANRMADNGAMMMVLKGSDGQFRAPWIHAQPLYATETIVEGTPAYINNDFEDHRDATLEEILHCVHDNGIGVDVRGAPKGVLAEYQKEIRAATTYAMENRIWPTGSSSEMTSEWIDELREEGSLTQEYLASVIDSYYGLWGPFEEDAGMWGIYQAKTRDDIKSQDSRGLAIVEKFFHPFLTYEAEIDSSFEGTFSMTFDTQKAYTHKSQYLLNARLTGERDSNLTGNNQDNQLAGNAGNNVIDGREGIDTVVFPRSESEYVVEKQVDGSVTVTGDGIDRLINIENLVFDGLEIESERFVDPVPAGLNR